MVILNTIVTDFHNCDFMFLKLLCNFRPVVCMHPGSAHAYRVVRDAPFDIRGGARSFFEEEKIFCCTNQGKENKLSCSTLDIFCLSWPTLEKESLSCLTLNSPEVLLLPYPFIRWWTTNNFQGGNKNEFVSPRCRWWRRKIFVAGGVTNKKILSRPQLPSPLLISNGASLSEKTLPNMTYHAHAVMSSLKMLYFNSI